MFVSKFIISFTFDHYIYLGFFIPFRSYRSFIIMMERGAIRLNRRENIFPDFAW